MQTGLNHSSIVLRDYKAAFVIFILYSYPLSALPFDIGIVACLIYSASCTSLSSLFYILASSFSFLLWSTLTLGLNHGWKDLVGRRRTNALGSRCSSLSSCC